MGLLKYIFGNLFNYKSTGLKDTSVDGREYRASGLERTAEQANSGRKSTIVALSFGAGTDKYSYNEVIAQGVIDAQKSYNTDRIVAQSEVATCLKRRGVDCESIGTNYSEGEASLVVSKVDTRYVLDRFKEKSETDKPSLVYVAHPAHMQRVMDIAKKRELGGETYVRKDVVWPKKDVQYWVRNPFVWAFREILTRIHHKLFGIT